MLTSKLLVFILSSDSGIVMNRFDLLCYSMSIVKTTSTALDTLPNLTLPKELREKMGGDVYSTMEFPM
jgi:hypothetical protein